MATWQINSMPSPFMPQEAIGYALADENTYCLATVEPVFAWGSKTVDAWKATAMQGRNSREAAVEKFPDLSQAQMWCEKIVA